MKLINRFLTLLILLTSITSLYANDEIWGLEYCASIDNITGNVGIEAKGFSTVETGDINIYNAAVNIDSSKTIIHITYPIEKISGLDEAQILALANALIPQILKDNEKLFEKFSEEVKTANKDLSKEILDGQKSETEIVLAEIKNTFDQFASLLETGILKINKGFEELSEYSSEDWINYFPFSKEGFAMLTYKGGTRGALIKSPDFKIIQHFYTPKGEMVPFFNITSFSNGGFSVVTSEEGKQAFINSDLRSVSEFYDQVFLADTDFGLVKQNEKFNFCKMPRNSRGKIKVITKKKYTFIEAEPFSAGFARVKKKKKSKWQYVNSKGKFFGKNFKEIGEVREGQAIVSVNKGFVFKSEKYGVIDANGKFIIKAKYNEILDSDVFYLLTENKHKFFVRKNNRDPLTHKKTGKLLKFKEAEAFERNIPMVCVKKKREHIYSLMDRNGYFLNGGYDDCYEGIAHTEAGAGLPNRDGISWDIPPYHEVIYKKSNGVYRAKLRVENSAKIVYYKNNRKLGHYVSIDSETIEPKNPFITGKDFHKGLAAVFTKGADGKHGWGFIDKNAEFVVPPIYKELLADFQNDNYALVKKYDGKEVYIDRNGKEKPLEPETIFTKM